MAQSANLVQLSAACLLLLLLLFCTHPPAVSTEGETSPAATKCQTMVPGIDKMAKGVDITSFELYPEDTAANSGYRKTLFDFTCDEGKTWTDPAIPGVAHKEPDQIQAVVKQSAGNSNIGDYTNEKMQKYKDNLSTKVGMEMGYLTGSFSTSLGYAQTKETILKTSKQVTETFVTLSSTEIDFKGSADLLLSKEFRDTLAALPPKYEDNMLRYDDFVNTFGTHYFDIAKFGGYLQLKTEVDKSYMEHANENTITANMHASFKMFIKVDTSAEMESITKEERKDFLRNSQLSFFFFGGKGQHPPAPEECDDSLRSNKSSSVNELFRNSSLPIDTSAPPPSNSSINISSSSSWINDWWETVPVDPWLFGGRLKGIESLVQDPVRKVQLMKAILFKRIRAYLKDYKYAIELSEVQIPPEEIAKLAEYERQLNDPTKSEAEIQRISDDIEAWFRKLQQKLDEIAQNKLDVGDQYEKFMRSVANDRSCPCYRDIIEGGGPRSLSECIGENHDPNPASRVSAATCKNYQVHRPGVQTEQVCFTHLHSRNASQNGNETVNS